MEIILFDSNVILDILSEDERWFSWSSETPAQNAEKGVLAINPIIYAEISVGFLDVESLDAAIPEEMFKRLPLPFEAAFPARKCFYQYRQQRGTKRSPLPDFYIGAHAAIMNMALMTRDDARYKTYFPGLKLISPNVH